VAPPPYVEEMEAFESFVAVSLESEGFVVSPAIKFPVSLRTRRVAYEEIQTHGYEVDLVAARADRLVLATVKSFFGSRGVVAEHVTGETTVEASRRLYSLLNNTEIRTGVVRGAAKQFGYSTAQVQLRLYVGRFAAPKRGDHEARIREWCRKQRVGAGPIEVIGLDEVVARVRAAAAHKQYRDNPVLVTMKVLEAAGLLRLRLPDDIGQAAE
jgi:hypothetical protein